jgi:tetratricopeptide (TPR) repeat protein
LDESAIYTVGGTVQPGGVYIKRKADDELLALCRQAEIALVLSSRQVGKSSLMVRTAEQLEADNIRSVIIDLSAIGTQVTQDEWYLGILHQINDVLKLKTGIFIWWKDHYQLGPTQRLINFFRDVLLKEVDEYIVLFFDEIDSTLSIPFADDFFAALRAAYNARSTTPEFRRLSFVLVGVATPSDLITDSKRTPFNLGRRVELTDFTLKEALPLAEGLGENPEQVLSWVLSWTGGHPYLTQHICSYLSKHERVLTEEIVEETIERLFMGELGWQNDNLQFVRDMLTKRAPDIRKVLNTYNDIRSGKKVVDDERSIIKSHIKLAGVVRRQDGQLIPRNRIYERIFDPEWIKENTPPSAARNMVIGASIILSAALIVITLIAYQEYVRTDAERADRFESNFRASNDPRLRLKNLAGILSLTDKSLGIRAKTLYNNLAQDEKLALFQLDSSANVKQDQLIVTLGIYQSLENTPEGDAILNAMSEAIQTNQPVLANEIDYWVAGREYLREKSYLDAKSNLNLAIQKNAQNPIPNPALYYDRAQVFILLSEENYPNALDDLGMMVRLDKNRVSDAYRLIQSNRPFSSYWTTHRSEYEQLSKIIPTATLTPIGTPTPSPTLTLTPSATNRPFSRLGLCIISDFVNTISVRSGPGTIYAPVGEPLSVGTCLFFSARNEQMTWLQVAPNQPEISLGQYEGGWIFRELLGLGPAGPIDLPAVTLTPSPLPSKTPTVTPTFTRTVTLTPTP